MISEFHCLSCKFMFLTCWALNSVTLVGWTEKIETYLPAILSHVSMLKFSSNLLPQMLYMFTLCCILPADR